MGGIRFGRCRRRSAVALYLRFLGEAGLHTLGKVEFTLHSWNVLRGWGHHSHGGPPCEAMNVPST
jgi:hypothetical protein